MRASGALVHVRLIGRARRSAAACVVFRFPLECADEQFFIGADAEALGQGSQDLRPPAPFRGWIPGGRAGASHRAGSERDVLSRSTGDF